MLARRHFLWAPLLGLLPSRSPRPREERPAPLPPTRIVLGGDVMLSRNVGRLARAARDPAWPFRRLAHLLSRADIAFVNLEAPFSDRGRPAEHGMIFRAAPEMIAGLRLAGVDVVSLANNHVRDCGDYGLEFTLGWLAGNAIAAAGAGSSEAAAHNGAVVERNGVRFGFLAYTYDQLNGIHADSDVRVALLDVRRMQEDVARLRSRAGVIIVSMHAGDEYRPGPNSAQVQFARAAIDAGNWHVLRPTPAVPNPVSNSPRPIRSVGPTLFWRSP